MPYDSEKQRRFMHAKHPGIAKKIDKESGGGIKKTGAIKSAVKNVTKKRATSVKKGKK